MDMSWFDDHNCSCCSNTNEHGCTALDIAQTSAAAPAAKLSTTVRSKNATRRAHRGRRHRARDASRAAAVSVARAGGDRAPNARGSVARVRVGPRFAASEHSARGYTRNRLEPRVCSCRRQRARWHQQASGPTVPSASSAPIVSTSFAEPPSVSNSLPWTVVPRDARARGSTGRT